MNHQASLDLKVWDKGAIQTLLAQSDKALCKALMTVYRNQTAAEQNSDSTREENGVGFTKFDAEYLTNIAKFLERTGFLTERQIAAVRKALPKYWKQLLKAAEAKGHAVSFKVPRPSKKKEV